MTGINRVKTALLVGATGFAIALASPVMAQEREFDVSAQSATTAIPEFARQAGVQIIAPGGLLRGKMTKPVEGQADIREALEQLLAGTGLRIVAFESGVVTLAAMQDTATTSSTDEPQTQSESASSIVSGTVTDALTGGGLPGAKVTVESTGAEAVTDDRGFFSLPGVPRSASTLIIEYVGQPTETFNLPPTADARRRLLVPLGQPDADIVVTAAFVSSTQKALNQQKNADNSSTVVSSDLLGGFPAETVSEALRRVPGVAFGRDDNTGEGSRITVRGFSSEAINIQLNGLDLQGTGFGRTVDLSGFLTDNISGITIHKSLLPSHESSGSGGLVEIETKSALDYGDFAASFAIEGESNFDRDFGDEYQVSGTITKKLTPDFAVSATAQYRKTDRLNYNVSILDELPSVFPVGVTSDFQIPVEAVFPFGLEAEEQQLIRAVNYVRRDLEQENILASLNFAWDVAYHTRLRLDLQRNINNETRVQSRSAVNFFPTNATMPIPELDGEVRTRRVLRAFSPSGGFETRESEDQFDTISFRGDTDLDRWSFDYKLGYSRARSKGRGSSISLGSSQNTDLASLIAPDTIVVNPDDDAAMTPRVVEGAFIEAPNGIPIPSLSAAGITRLFDASEYYVLSAFTNEFDNPTTSYIAELKTRYSPKSDFIEYVEIGGKYDGSTRRTSDDVTNSENSRSTVFSGNFSNRISLTQMGVDFLAEDLGIIGAPGTQIPFLTGADSDTLFAQFLNFLEDDPSTPGIDEGGFTFSDRSGLDSTIDGASALAPTKVTENLLAAYLETKLTLGDFSLIAGGRYEREKRTGNSLTFPSVTVGPGFASEPSTTFLNAGLYEFTSLSGTVETFTPSFLATWRPTQNIVARLGYFRSTVHPDIRLLNRGTIFSANFRAGFERVQISEANPDLKPTKTNNLDFDVAYYFTDSPGLIRGSLFYKKTTNNFTNVSFGAVPGDNILERYLAYLQPLAATRPDLLAVPDNANLLISRPVNGEGGTIWGAELELIRRLDFLPGFLSDFGVLANVTYTNGDYPTLISVRRDGVTVPESFNRPLADQAEWAYNLSLDYNKNGFEGRVIYTSQTADGRTFDEFNRNVISPAYSTLDVRLSYNFDQLGGLWTIFLEGDNLLRGTREPDIRQSVSSQFGDGDVAFDFPQNYQFIGGRSVSMGVRARF